MAKDIFGNQIKYDILSGNRIGGKRKPFSIKTKKIEWMRAAGRDPFGTFVKTSKCRRCKRKLIWGDRTYEFDHKDNNPTNNRQKNCYLACKICHGKATVIKKRKVRDRFTGRVIGHKTIKKKVGYKKTKKKKTIRKRKSFSYETYINPLTGRKERRKKSSFGLGF